MQVLKQWTAEHRTTRKTGSGRRRVKLAHDDRHLLRMALNDRTASSRRWLAARWSTAIGDHDDHICVRRYAGERCLPECSIELHSGLTRGVMPEVVPFGIRGTIFQQDYAHPYVAKTVRDLCSAQLMKLLPLPAYSPDMSPIEHMWDLVGRRLTPDPRPAVSKYELLLRMEALQNSLLQADIQNLFDSMPRRIVALFAVRSGYTKY
ncbi:transposable element Tcb2 transposase [Trichonephila clavipes]|nr:transposable element Tcb2 transposase [Trichonephila clavipes]